MLEQLQGEQDAEGNGPAATQGIFGNRVSKLCAMALTSAAQGKVSAH